MIAYKERPGGHYSPQPFARMGLCLLTGVIVLAVIGFLLLLLTTGIVRSETGYGVFCIAMGLGSYMALELFISEKGHCRSGVDDALLFFAVLLTCIGIALLQPEGPFAWTWAVYGLICGWGMLRFGDRLMAAGWLYCFLAAIWYATARSGLPGHYGGILLLAAFSLAVNLSALRLSGVTAAQPYADVLLVLRYASLLTLYGSLNYHFVRKMSYDLGPDPTPAGNVIPGWHTQIFPPPAAPWFFWTTTFALPLLYLVLGIRRRSRPALHVGMGTLAAAILTFRYYHHILPPAEAMTLAGVLLIGLAWGLIRFLREPRGGITSAATDKDPVLSGVELLAVTQAFGAHTATPDVQPPAPGGGSFGGAGAGGDF